MLWGDHGRSTKHGPCPLAPCHLDGEKRCASLEMTGDGSAVTQDRGPDRVTQVSVLKNLQSARVTQPHCTSNQLHKTSQQRLERPKSRAAGRKWGRWCIWWLRVGRAVSGRTRCPAESERESLRATSGTTACYVRDLGPLTGFPRASRAPAVSGD